MKVTIDPPIPPEPTITIEMTKTEAKVLRWIARNDLTVPDAIIKHGQLGISPFDAITMSRVLGTLNTTLKVLD